MVDTSAGSKILIGTTASDPDTDTFVEISDVTNLGQFGRSYSAINFSSLGDRNVIKFKGQRDDGSIQLDLGRTKSDPGQAAIALALDDDDAYNFQVHLNDKITPNKSHVVTMTIASPGVISWVAHGLPNGTPVTLETTGLLPTGLTPGTQYYVVATATDTFELSLTRGGSAIVTSGSQSGTHTAYAEPGTPTVFDFKAKVMSYTTNVGSNTQVVAAQATLGIDSGTITETPAT